MTHIPTAAELRTDIVDASGQIDRARVTADDLAAARSALADHTMALARGATGKTASDVRSREAHSQHAADLAGLVDEIERALPADPAHRKMRFGSEAIERRLGRTTADDVSRLDRLGRGHSVLSWMQARGQARDDASHLSFDRYVRGLATGNWHGATAEHKAHATLAMSEGTASAGGHLVPAPLSGRVIDLARNASRVFQAGAVTVPMTAQTLKVARLTGEGTPGWHAENAAITDADLTFDAVTFTARTLTRLVKVSIELFEDADPSSEDVIAKSFANQIALELDRVALRGTGTAPEPRGVLNHTGVTLTDHGANGDTIANLTYNFLIDAVGTARNSNFEPNAQIEAPRTETSLAKLKDTTNQHIAPPKMLDGIPRLTSKQVPTNLTVGSSTDCSEVYTGQWDQLMIGIRTNFALRFLGERFIDNGQYAFFAYLRADVQLAHGEAFVVDRGVRG